jgi:hypothetical protein
MKFAAPAAFFAAAGMLLATMEDASAHGRRGHARLHIGVMVGAPLLYYPYYPRPYYYAPAPAYYYPPPVYYAPPPPSSIVPPGQYSWHFCPGAQAYYPQVKECPGGWQRVTQPPPPPPPLG